MSKYKPDTGLFSRLFWRRGPIDYSGSLGQIAWQKFCRNRLSMVAFSFIILAILVALLGYHLTPDRTPLANRQHLELSAVSPGFTVDMLQVRRNASVSGGNFFRTMLFGQRSPYELVPIYSKHYGPSSLIVELYTGDSPNDGPMQEYSYANIVYPLDVDRPVVFEDGQFIFYDVEGNEVTACVEELKHEVSRGYISQQRYLLGSDRFGRDMLSRLLIGTRVSLAVGFISVFISLVIGITLGAIAGYFRGWVDDLIIWLINVVWSIPTLLLVIAITFALGKGFWQIFVAVGMTMWVEVARVVRGQVLSVREKEHVEAARALGYKSFRIITRHILPNVMGAVIVISAANFASAILIEAGLSFLGIGVQPPMPSWGTMIKDHYGYIILDAAYLAILPGLAIMMMVLAFMIVGNGLRDALDVKSQSPPA